MVVNLDSLVINSFLVYCQFVVGMYKSEVGRVVILCICELVINCSLFFVRNKSTESIYCDGTGRIFNSVNGCQQEAFLLKFIIILF